ARRGLALVVTRRRDIVQSRVLRIPERALGTSTALPDVADRCFGDGTGRDRPSAGPPFGGREPAAAGRRRPSGASTHAPRERTRPGAHDSREHGVDRIGRRRLPEWAERGYKTRDPLAPIGSSVSRLRRVLRYGASSHARVPVCSSRSFIRSARFSLTNSAPT